MPHCTVVAHALFSLCAGVQVSVCLVMRCVSCTLMFMNAKRKGVDRTVHVCLSVRLWCHPVVVSIRAWHGMSGSVR